MYYIRIHKKQKIYPASHLIMGLIDWLEVSNEPEMIEWLLYIVFFNHILSSWLLFIQLWYCGIQAGVIIVSLLAIELDFFANKL